MKELLRAGCELLTENKNIISKNFQWDMEMMAITGAVIHTSAGKTVDIERLKECKKILKKHQGVFSAFRSNMEIPVISKMAISDDPEGYLIKLLNVYNVMSKGKIFDSEYMAMAALAICDESLDGQYEIISENTKTLLKMMSKIHPMLTSGEDTAFAALLSASGKTFDQIIDETEYCYNVMKRKFSYHNNAVQSLSHVLTLMPGDAQAKCDRVSAIYDALLTKGVTYGKDYELASLGALVTVDMTPEELAGEIAEACTFLKGCKGFGDWSLGKKTRAMFAALLAAQAFSPNSVVMDTSILSTSLAMVIAEEVCLMCCTMAVVSTSTSN
ncbi:MAG: DUF4003 family protein [Lachnospiraceae bacterium]|nr:DUF4003 family protein [Lachnospiraceae bacterium]